jgi:hypothetical protein
VYWSKCLHFTSLFGDLRNRVLATRFAATRNDYPFRDREPPRPRLKILNSVEREAFDFPPIFNTVERKRCFDFPAALQDIATSPAHGEQSVGVVRSNPRTH